ncbi:MAG: hypothetical protein GXO11_04420 [Epsilonproteobacteria bacterium]|nr:hypothetical protein [Campylobacterota bacterium]
MKKPPASEVFKDYTPEIITYDPAIDYGEEWMQREELLDTKAKLIQKIKQAKSARKGNRTTYRAPIRTENL